MKTKQAKRDIAAYALLLLAGVVLYVWVIPSQVYLNSAAKAERFSPDTFPRFVTAVLLFAALGGLINGIRLYRRAAAEEGRPERVKRQYSAREVYTELVPYLVFLLILFYGMLFKSLGFVWATVLVPPVILLVIGCRKWHYYAILYAFNTVMYLLFRYILLVPIH